ncbi:hypothetical protein M405DRAFT_867249 [Rhizopogon salebrosus TDB-379]|nr:hypothetical protein M405DRAFT_867249 [Rhizopogon salebrosus TDB-379]
MSNHVSTLRSLDINIAAYSSGRDQTLIVYDGVDGFVEALDSMADECNLHLYRGVLYNMPYKVLASPPYYCVSLGPYIGIFTLYLWKDIESDTRSYPGAIYHSVDSLEMGEERVRLAIERGVATNRGPYHFKLTTSQ